MSNTNVSPSLILIENAAQAMDIQVLEMLQPLGFSDSLESWSVEFDVLFPERYRSKVQERKDAIHMVAQRFRGTDRAEQLLQSSSDIGDRLDIIRGTLAALDVLSCPEVQGFTTMPFDLDRLHMHMPALRDVVRTVTGQATSWQRDFRRWQAVFVTLEASTLIGTLFESLPATIPDTYVSQGRGFLNRLIEGCNNRKAIVEEANSLAHSDQDPRPLLERLAVERDTLPSVINLFKDIVQDLDNLPILRLLGREHVARRFWEADGAYDRLKMQRDSISRDVSRLECIMDHLMGVVDAAAGPALL